LDQLGKSALCSAAAVVIANSHAVARHLPSREQIAVVHNGINTLTFGPTGCGDPFRHAHGIPDSVPLVGMVGRLRPWKGQERFLRMAATVAETQPDVHFVLVGDDPFSVQDGYAKRLRALSAELGLRSRLTFTGHLDDVRPAFAAMDVFVHPGDPEPFGLVNIEAMAMEKPVVALAHGALPEIVDHGRTGLLVSPVDGTDLARSVRILLNEPAYARCLGRAGRQRAVEHFDVRMTARRIEQVFRRLTGGQL
jgi:glycosyltransferase involved in cell wall biosynthesis